jgi:hypothetical protein
MVDARPTGRVCYISMSNPPFSSPPPCPSSPRPISQRQMLRADGPHIAAGWSPSRAAPQAQTNLSRWWKLATCTAARWWDDLGMYLGAILVWPSRHHLVPAWSISGPLEANLGDLAAILGHRKQSWVHLGQSQPSCGLLAAMVGHLMQSGLHLFIIACSKQTNVYLNGNLLGICMTSMDKLQMTILFRNFPPRCGASEIGQAKVNSNLASCPV